ncbi:MAG: hypothetical protein AAF541_17925 [Pseudomonadota bacterium]
MQDVYGAPGDVLFSDDFDVGAGCDTLAPQWTTTSTNLGGIGTQTSNSGNCAMFTRGNVVSNTSITIDLGTVTGADLDLWVRRGADSFSEDTDAGEDLVIEYIDEFGLWIALTALAGSGTNGQIINLNFEIPADGLHAALQIRFRQTGGNGGPPANSGIGYDYWHIDDVVLTETGTPPPPPPTSSLGAGLCDDFESGFTNWQTTDTVASGINNDTANSTVNSMFLRHNAVTTTALPFDSAGVSDFEVWVRRGADSFSENPDGGENLVVQYLNASSTWVTLETFTGSGTQGQIFNRTYNLPDAGRHANFRVRFTLTSGSGSDFDYWHVDDVCFVAGAADIEISKTITFEQDPVNGATDPFAIPGGWMIYELTVTNNGIGVPDDNSLVISDSLDVNTTFFAGDFDGGGSPFVFTNGTGAQDSGLSLPFNALGDIADGVEFLDGLSSSITPNPDFDEDVREFVITFPGQMAGSSDAGSPTFSIEYRVRLE